MLHEINPDKESRELYIKMKTNEIQIIKNFISENVNNFVNLSIFENEPITWWTLFNDQLSTWCTSVD